MPVADGEVIRVQVSMDLPSLVLGMNVYYWQMDDPDSDTPSNVQVITVLDTKLTAMYNDLASQISDEILVDEFSVDKIEWNVDHWETVENVGGAPLAVAGTNVGDAMPHGVAAVVTANTLRPQTRGRKFFPGFAEGSAEDSVWDGATLTALAQLIVEWLTNPTPGATAELVPVVVGQSGPSAGLVYALVSAAAQGIAGYQRRRKPGVGA